MLGDLGADVVKIEAPANPDPLREWGLRDERGRAYWWPVISRNKRCLTLNLREVDGQDLFVELVKRSDVVIENFRPGTLERWNLGWERLSAANPSLILCRISGYGQSGEYSHRAGYASVAEAFSGLRYLNGFPGGPPPRTGVSLGDSLGSLFATQGVLAALYRREVDVDRQGQAIDVSLVDSCFALLESVVSEYDRLGAVREPSGTGIKGVAPSNIFRSRDGIWMVVAANQDSVFGRLCAVMGRGELAEDPRFRDHRSRGENQEELEAIIVDWASAHDAKEIDDLLNDAGVVCGPVNTVAEVFSHPYFRERGLLIDHDDGDGGTFVGPGVVPRFSATPGRVRWSGGAAPGADNHEILGELGLDASAVAELQERGIV
jgi:formyl-CoA transferase